jgi:uncharacterized protein (TIGR02117 family)
VAACATPPPTSSASGAVAATESIYVVRRGWHVDVGIAAPDAQAELRAVRADFPAANYLLFGFGDRRYLLHRGAGNLLAAIWPGAGVVLVTALRATPQRAFGPQQVIRLSVTPTQLQALQTYIAQSLGMPGSSIARLADGPYDDSAYYQTSAHYSALHTCNTWAAEALQAAGLPVGSRGVEFASQLWRQVLRLGSPDAHSADSGGLTPPCPRCPGAG